jgi:type I restriction enzyme S subunit
MWVKLSDVALINHRDPIIRELPDDMQVTFVPMAAVDAEKGIIAEPERRNLSDVKRGYTPFSNGDVLFAKITPSMENGKAAIAKDLINHRGFGSTEFHVLTPRDGILSEWLFYFIRQEKFRQDAKARFKGTAGQLRVPKGFLEHYEIPLAPLKEQRRIVEKIEQLVTQLDAGLAELYRVQANLARYKASVLKAACEGRLVPTEAELARTEGRDYESGEELLQRMLAERKKKWEEEQRAKGKDPSKMKYKEPEAPDTEGLPELAEGWVWATMNMLTETVGGVTKGRNFRGRPTIFAPYLRVANVQRGNLDLDVIKDIEILEEELNRYRLEEGDLLLTEGGDWDKLGRSAIWRNQIPNCIHQNHIFRARSYLKELPTRWLMYSTNSDFGRKYFAGSSKQTTNLASINLTQLRSCPIPLPPLQEQQRIISEVERLLTIMDEVEIMTDINLRRAERMRQAILKRAFEGKLVPQDPEDAPASKLLEQIGTQSN